VAAIDHVGPWQRQLVLVLNRSLARRAFPRHRLPILYGTSGARRQKGDAR
jgi:hypothetical protein